MHAKSYAPIQCVAVDFVTSHAFSLLGREKSVRNVMIVTYKLNLDSTAATGPGPSPADCFRRIADAWNNRENRSVSQIPQRNT